MRATSPNVEVLVDYCDWERSCAGLIFGLQAIAKLIQAKCPDECSERDLRLVLDAVRAPLVMMTDELAAQLGALPELEDTVRAQIASSKAMGARVVGDGSALEPEHA